MTFKEAKNWVEKQVPTAAGFSMRCPLCGQDATAPMRKTAEFNPNAPQPGGKPWYFTRAKK